MNSTKIEKNQTPLQKLLGIDPKLQPDELAKIFPKYKKFEPLKNNSEMWISTKKLATLEKNFGKHKKIMLLMSGISAGGKDAVREKIQTIKPNFLFKAVTATTRDIRKDEKNGTDYYFYNKKKFLSEVKKNNFIEHTLFGENHYGSPKKSFDDALKRLEPVVCSHVEMKDGWPGVEQYFSSEYKGEKPFILKVFVMPNMEFSKYVNKWLPKIRNDWQKRSEIASWEISVAAQKADIILINKITKKDQESLKKQADGVIKLAFHLLASK